MNVSKLFSNEWDENMLKTGFVKPLNYILNDTEQLEHIKYFKITLRKNKSYEIEINYNHNNKSEYWTFGIDNIINNGNKITGQLFDISLEGTDEIVYTDENSIGKIESDKENNLIYISIIHKIHKNYMINCKIVWKNETSLPDHISGCRRKRGK
jgi:hypothetical protein